MTTEARRPIRVLVVDDSYFMRKMVTELLTAPGGAIKVVDTAQNGLEAVEKNKSLKPDVITMDVEMPEMDGLAALERIMREAPTPVVMLSNHTGQGTDTAIRALEMGAVDCVLKPSGKPIGDMRAIQMELAEKITLAAHCRLGVKPMAKQDPQPPPATREGAPEPKPARALIAVASSTGGPRALHELLSHFPAGLPAAVLIVQHISIGFTQALARRLDESSPLKVEEASEGQPLWEGHAYLAPAGRHMVVRGTPGFFRIALTDDPPRLGVRPSGDIMMRSVSQAAGRNVIGIVLTGMGKDGTEGLRDIRDNGGRTFAQNEESCVIYGMPRSAKEAGVVNQQLPLDQIAFAASSLFPQK